MRFATRAVHQGVYQDTQYRSVTTPIYTTSTYAWPPSLEEPGFDYGRTDHPNRRGLAENIASLEGGAYGVVTLRRGKLLSERLNQLAAQACSEDAD